MCDGSSSHQLYEFEKRKEKEEEKKRKSRQEGKAS